METAPRHTMGDRMLRKEDGRFVRGRGNYVDDVQLRYRPYPAARGRQAILANRDIIRLFPDLRVSDSFLLQNNLREILFRKPTYETR